MFYYRLKQLPDAKRERAVVGLRRLRTLLDGAVPRKDSDQNLLIATWNIRDLTKRKDRRLEESLHYIAETISRFDLVAVQEVNELEEWERIVEILGPEWAYIASDVADTASGGNGERLTYAYDKRKVWFQNVAGELVLPPKLLITGLAEEDGGPSTGLQFARTPYVARFQSGWLRLAICTVHIYYGKETGPALERRRREIQAVAEYFGERADAELRKREALVLLGDFNILSPEHETMKALLGAGFLVPDALKQLPSNAERTKHYDQVAFKTKRKVIEYADSPGNAGVVDYYGAVFRSEDAALYTEERGADPRRFETWRTWQMSDHLPMWVRLDVNDVDEYLARVERGQ